MLSNKIYCIYHSSDFDGKCSAAIVNSYYKNNIEFIGYNYNEDIVKNIDEGTIVILVDITLPLDDMLWLEKNVKLIWIDHHKLRINKVYDAGFKNIDGLRCLDGTKSASDLTWEFFYPNKTIPESIYLIGRFDVWDHLKNWDTHILPFQYGLKLEKDTKTPKSDIWKDIFKDKINSEILQNGRIVLKHAKNEAEYLYDKMSTNKIINNLTWKIINTPTAPDAFDHILDWQTFDVFCTYRIGQYFCSASLRSNSEIDVAKIAEKYGGGGHKNSAGFKTKNIKIFLGDEF